MDLRDLAFFEVIAETGHLGRASEKLGRTQPALTKCIQRLEASVGAELFARSGRGDLTGWLWTGLIERISQDRRSRTCGEVRRRARSRWY